MRFATFGFSVVFLLVLLASCASTPSTITVNTMDGSQSVTVLRVGATANEQIVGLATTLRATSRELSRVPPAQVSPRDLVARDAYDEAVLQLIELNDFVTRTSTTPATEKVSSIQKLALEAQRILTRPSNAPDHVTTKINADVGEEYYILYVSARKHRKASSSDWQSYSFGQRLHIGMYVFRVVPTRGKGFEEKFVVIDDPTERTLLPR